MVSYLEKKINQIVKWWESRELKKKILAYKEKYLNEQERENTKGV